MNEINFGGNSWAWQLAAWTMIHSLWIGGAVAILGAAVRVACRRTPAAVRYGISLATLALVAATPAAIAGWLATHPDTIAAALAAPQPRALPGGHAKTVDAPSGVGWDAVPPFPDAEGGTASQPTDSAPLSMAAPTQSAAFGREASGFKKSELPPDGVRG